MLKEVVTIKQAADQAAAQFGLQKYNRSKIPGTFDWLMAGQNRDSRYITGIDEEALEVNLIDDDTLREKKKKELLAFRLKLEKALGLNKDDLSATSPFWETFTVKLDADNDLVLSRINPNDVLKYNVLIANGYVAPSIEDLSNPRYRLAKYYAHSKEVAKKENVSTQKKRDQARSKLFEIQDNKDYMVTLGQYLEGPKYTEKNSPDDLYYMLSSFIDDVNNPDNLTKFLKAVKKPTDELQFKIVIDKALRSKIIKFTNHYYQRGQVTLGKNIEDVYNNLKSPEFAAEFLSIKQELED